MTQTNFNILNLRSGRVRTLHLTWFAFFLSFVVWFNHAPLLALIRDSLALSDGQVKALLILNVALTIPARIIIGMLVDRFGPRRVYSGLLMAALFPCLGFALATTYEQLALMRFLLGFVGAGFVIGIRMVGEWFPARQVGLAEGIYGGWGNFGSAAAAIALPAVAMTFGGENGWRYAVGLTGVIAFLYGIVYYLAARDTPKGATYFKPKRSGGLEVSSVRDFYFYLVMNVPMYVALGLLLWRLSPSGVDLLAYRSATALAVVLAAVFGVQAWQIYRVNRSIFYSAVRSESQYAFKQVAILDIAYMVTFGSELAVVSMLPLFFMDTFALDPVYAGILASGFAFMNLLARPSGGWLSDRFGRKLSLSVLIAGLAVGYLLLSQVDGTWWMSVAVIACMVCSLFVQAGEGAVFAVVPLVQRRMTGQIAGMTGAYGNVGAVLFLTVLSFVDASTFFLVIAASSVIAFAAVQFLDEPRGHTVEVAPDGSVQLIKVS